MWIQYLVIFQWVAIIVLAVFMLGIARQIGVLHRRIGPAGALMTSSKAKVGDPSPIFNLKTIDGMPLSIGGAAQDGKSTLIAFVAPDCPVCKSLIPIYKAIASEESGRMNLVFASDGFDEARQQAYRDAHALQNFPYVLSMELGMAFEIAKLPYAVLIGPDGKVAGQGLVNTREHIESLLEAQRMRVSSIQDYLEKRA
ncbi:MAG: methylamine dehydrogenase accessory protein MauD [Pseudomonadota bacterium]